jgi:hypothetical protein
MCARFFTTSGVCHWRSLSRIGVDARDFLLDFGYTPEGIAQNMSSMAWTAGKCAR